MGLITGMLTLPLAPVRGVTWVAEQLAREADRQLYDEREIRRQLLALEMEYDEGRIDEAQRQEREDVLLERLALSRSYRAGTWEGGPDG